VISQSTRQEIQVYRSPQRPRPSGKACHYSADRQAQTGSDGGPIPQDITVKLSMLSARHRWVMIKRCTPRSLRKLGRRSVIRSPWSVITRAYQMKWYGSSLVRVETASFGTKDETLAAW